VIEAGGMGDEEGGHADLCRRPGKGRQTGKTEHVVPAKAGTQLLRR
jgi:hypothetical protein